MQDQKHAEGLPTWPENTWIPPISIALRLLSDSRVAPGVVSFAQLQNCTWAENWQLGQ